MRRARLPIGLVLVALCVSPVAISWACNPQAQLFTNKTVYSPGETMVVLGSSLPPNTGIAITRSGGLQTTVTTLPNGSLEASLTAPSAPGL